MPLRHSLRQDLGGLPDRNGWIGRQERLKVFCVELVPREDIYIKQAYAQSSKHTTEFSIP